MSTSRSMKIFALLVLIVVACGTDPLDVRGSTGRTIHMVVGQELDVTLQTIGPGEYESPPAISTSSLRFLNAALVAPYVPAGPTQQFRFRGVSRGQAIITFVHSGTNPTVTDTVEVR